MKLPLEICGLKRFFFVFPHIFLEISESRINLFAYPSVSRMNLFTYFSVKKTNFSFKVNCEQKMNIFQKKQIKANLRKRRDAKPWPKVRTVLRLTGCRINRESPVFIRVDSFHFIPNITFYWK